MQHAQLREKGKLELDAGWHYIRLLIALTLPVMLQPPGHACVPPLLTRSPDPSRGDTEGCHTKGQRSLPEDWGGLDHCFLHLGLFIQTRCYLQIFTKI